MIPHLLNMIYRVWEVEAVAILSQSGEIVENQLTLEDKDLQILATNASSIIHLYKTENSKLGSITIQINQYCLFVCCLDNFVFIIHITDPAASKTLERRLLPQLTTSILANSSNEEKKGSRRISLKIQNAPPSPRR